MKEAHSIFRLFEWYSKHSMRTVILRKVHISTILAAIELSHVCLELLFPSA